MTAKRHPALVISAVWLMWTALPISSQVTNELQIEAVDGSVQLVGLDVGYGFATVPLTLFERLGWSTTEADDLVVLLGPEQIEIKLGHRTSFFRWNDQSLQFVDFPYRIEGETYIPVQLLTDFFPKRLPTLYAFNEVDFTIQAADPSEWKGDELSQAKPGEEVLSSDTLSLPDPTANPNLDLTHREQSSSELIPDPVEEERRIVVIDPGHGGGDPGALGPQGLREKDVALAVAKIMADLLSREKGVDVYLTRSEDSFVPLWKRGELATQWKGENPGVFISVHANSAPERRSVRGFETYSLNVARTEHERRVVAIENAPLQVQGQSIDPDSDPEFAFLLRDLSNSGHQPWSVELSRIVQEEIGRFHPGPDRGIKQGPLAVLTNALMPSVLVEVGFLSNEDEGPLLGQDQFQDETARAVARAVMNFFDRYPPGTGEN
ncbi:MAG: N-acetylmuramoyl-L-alanine amidase [Gemmatimonadetes bacterium]|nr:N-acetylmuramoyl-L-alanine amidase [Gemmatimonadota bacterium]